MTGRPAASLAWTADPDAFAWVLATIARLNDPDYQPMAVGDTGADHGPVEPDGPDGDWLACREENIGRGRCA